MTAQHTPGPWKTSATTAYWIIYDPDSKPVATTLGPKLNKHAKSEANARLIAAAPDLLEALQSVHQWMDDQADAQSKGGHATFDLTMLREQRDRARAAIARATHKEQT